MLSSAWHCWECKRGFYGGSWHLAQLHSSHRVNQLILGTINLGGIGMGLVGCRVSMKGYSSLPGCPHSDQQQWWVILPWKSPRISWVGGNPEGSLKSNPGFYKIAFPCRVQERPLEEEGTGNVFVQFQLLTALCFHGQAPPAHLWHWGMPLHGEIWIFQEKIKSRSCPAHTGQ